MFEIGEEIECNAKKTKNDVAAESSPVHSGQQSYSVSSPELTINNKHGIHTVKDVNISTQECVEGKQRGLSSLHTYRNELFVLQV